MKQHFSDTSSRSHWDRLQEYVRGGGLQRGIGLVLVGVLAVAGASGALFFDRLNEGEVSERHFPPHNVVLQQLLYHPPVRLDSVSQQQDGGPLFGARVIPISARSQEEPSATRPNISSRATYTAVVGETYRYQVQADLPGGKDEEIMYSLESGPRGMELDKASGRLEWTPEPSHQGERTVEVAAYGPEGQGMKQTFDVYVSETVHPFGTDWRGRGMGGALLLGARWALLPGSIAVLISMLLGTLVGGLAGYYERTMDRLLTYVANVTEAVPSLVLLFLAAVIFQYNIFLIMAIVGIILFPRVAAAVKAKVQSLKARQFVEASRELGLRDRVILWRDIVWYNARPQLLLQASHAFVFAIIVEVTLSYLNLGIQVPEVSWGNLLSQGKDQILYGMYWPVVLPGVAIVGAVAAFYLLADGIRRRYEIANG